MTNLVQEFEKQQIDQLASKKRIPAFRPGDTLKVTLKIVEGERSRLQIFEGVCIARKNNSINSKFTVRKISHGEGVERVFPLFSQIIDKIEVVRKGDVKRAKLYYLRDRTGKRARIADRDRGDELDQYSFQENTSQEDNLDQEKTHQNEENKIKEKNIDENIKKNTSSNEVANKKNEEIAAEDTKSAEEKSESTAKEAEKTEDESK